MRIDPAKVKAPPHNPNASKKPLAISSPPLGLRIVLSGICSIIIKSLFPFLSLFEPKEREKNKKNICLLANAGY